MKPLVHSLFMIITTLCISSPAYAEKTLHTTKTVAAPMVQGLMIKVTPSKTLNTIQNTTVMSPLKQQQLQRLSHIAGVPLTYARLMSGGAHVVKFSKPMTAAAAQHIATIMANDPSISAAEPDIRMHPMLLPSDPEYINQWHYHTAALHGMNLEAAWDITTGSANVVTAVIDTGILPHADLAGRLLPGYDMISDPYSDRDATPGRDADPTDTGDWAALDFCGAGVPASDSSWHGTHVAGTIGAATNNGLGVAGVDWLGKILPVRAMGACGGLLSDILDAMAWGAGLAVQGTPINPNPANVLNLSLGGGGQCGQITQAIINQITAKGSVVVVAAGNESANTATSSPANCNGVITVAAHNRASEVTMYSNYGTEVDIMAPGGEQSASISGIPYTQTDGILSTLDSGLTTALNDHAYQYYQGTSMATPHVAGLMALMFAVNPTRTPVEMLAALKSSVRPFIANGWCAKGGPGAGLCGAGIVDAHAAVVAASGPSLMPAKPSSLQASALSSSSTNLSWVDNANNETGFKIERRITAMVQFQEIAHIGSNTSSYNDTTTAASTSYDYRVKAAGVVDSAYSNIAVVSTPASSGGGCLAATNGVGKLGFLFIFSIIFMGVFTARKCKPLI